MSKNLAIHQTDEYYRDILLHCTQRVSVGFQDNSLTLNLTFSLTAVEQNLVALNY